MIAWIIALILFICLLATLFRHFKALKACEDRYEAALYEAKARSNFSEEAFKEVEKWKKRYLAELAAKKEQIKEAEEWKKRYWAQIHEDSDSYKTQTRKEEESWGDNEPY